MRRDTSGGRPWAAARAALWLCLLAACATGGLARAQVGPADSASLHLTVSLPGRPPAPAPEWETLLYVTVELGETEIMTQTLTCDQVGAWTLEGLSSGSAAIRVRGANTLTNLREGLALSPGLNLAYMGRLRAGDLNQDEAVDVVDFSLFRARFATADPLADLDNSGWVDIADFALLRTSFGLRGPVRLTGDERP
ncbi:MAG: hypothetical protein GXY76_04700 [Chloroflexi bacterium]|nr:hypothetical protein [Chloroflexota bacterium]